MANSLKKKTPPPPNPDELKQEKEEQVTVKEVVKDERTTKIAGAVSLLIAAFLFVSFTSYFFTWQNDQDKVFQFTDVFKENVKVSNMMGVLGAYFSHLFIYKGFGVASYLFCTFFFVLGINLLFGKKIFSLARNLKYVIVGLLVLSVATSFFTTGSSFSWGGAAGELMNDWLVKWIGSTGTGALLAVAVLSYIIWRFNPTFRLPERKPRIKKELQPVVAGQDAKLFIDDEAVIDAEPSLVRSVNDLYTDDDAGTSNNKLKKEGKGVSVIMPKNEDDPLIAFDIIEKDTDDLTEDELDDINKLPLDVKEEELAKRARKGFAQQPVEKKTGVKDTV